MTIQLQSFAVMTMALLLLAFKKCFTCYYCDRLCGLVVRVLGYRFGGLGSIPGTTRRKKNSGSGTGSTQPREYT
jgi:hypothetical protein